MSAVDHEAAVAKLLADLGDTADAVADRLRALEIKGEKDEARSCPIANYVRAGMPECEHMVVSALPSRVRTRRADTPISGWDWVPTPPPVREFIKRFDDGVYLDLVEVES